MSLDQKLPNRWVVLLLLLGIAIFNYADRFLLAGLIMPIKAEFGVSDGFMGLLLGPAFAILYSTLAIPIAVLADRVSRIRIIVVGCVIWSLFTILSGFATTPWMLAVARVGVGIGEAAFQAPAYALVAAYFPIEKRGRAFAVMALASYIGQMLGFGVGPAIAAVHDWRFAFKLFGGIGLAVVALAWLVIREPAHRDAPAVRMPVVPLTVRLFGFASYRGIVLGLGLGVMSGLAFGAWGAALFARNYGMAAADAGALFGKAVVVPGMAGALLFGLLSDRLGRLGYHRMTQLSAVSLALATLGVLCVIWAPTADTAFLIAIPAGIFGGGWAVGIYAALQYILPDHLRATGTAIAMLALNLLGFVLGPWLVGLSSDAFGAEAHGLRMALSVIVPLGLVGALLIVRSGGAIDNDRQSLAAPAA